MATVSEICFDNKDFFISKKPILSCIQNDTLIKLEETKIDLETIFSHKFLELLQLSCIVN